jgi:hypothetical protein
MATPLTGLLVRFLEFSAEDGGPVSLGDLVIEVVNIDAVVVLDLVVEFAVVAALLPSVLLLFAHLPGAKFATTAASTTALRNDVYAPFGILVRLGSNFKNSSPTSSLQLPHFALTSTKV